METVKDFESFYTIKIQPFLNELDNEQHSAYNWKKFTLYTGAGAFLCFLLYFIKIFPSGHILAIGMLLMCIIGVFFWTRYNDRYLDDFKEKIIGQIISFINPSAKYKPMGFVSKKEYKASGLYRRRFSHFDGDDYWQSVYNGVTFHCSEIVARYEDVAGTENIFKGLFFVANLNNTFRAGTYIWLKGRAQLPASLADEQYRMFSLPHVQRLKIDHEGFNDMYTVYTTSAEEASMILSYNMMDHMLAIKNKLNKDIVFSFVAGKCYIAVPFNENLLEPSEKGLRDKEVIKNYFYTILLVYNIIKKLELNRLA
ncbi:MAG: DUF3137 domain-containing protein [Chitinophagaceae bacterium]|nr:DUF3137 domain-containing protein [Chitinophagaceae bacterium]